MYTSLSHKTRGKFRTRLTGLGLLLCSFSALAGNAVSVPDSLDFLELENAAKKLKKLNISGAYVFYGYGRTLDQLGYFSNQTKRTLQMGDNAFSNEGLRLQIGANPSYNSSFNLNLDFTPDFMNPTTVPQIQIGDHVTLSGNVDTRHGNFGIRVGGQSWTRISQFTLWQNELYNRFSIFERNPWETTSQSGKRYQDYYDAGAINFQDARWGNKGFQGLIIDASELPQHFEGKILLGKTDNNGGIESYLTPNQPDNLVGAKVTKYFENFTASLNTFNRIARFDSISRVSQEYHIHTFEFKTNVKGIVLKGEIGAGNYVDPTYPKSWSEGIDIKAVLPKKMIGFPLEVQLYQLGKNFVNLNGTVINTSIANARSQSATLSQSQSIQPFNSPMTQVGVLTNNRRGINFNTETALFHRIKLNIGYGMSSEIEKINPGVTYTHNINGQAIARLNPWAANVGPYQRLFTGWRMYFEEVNLTDVDTATGLPLNGKSFNDLEFQAKYKTRILGKPIYLFNLTQIHTVQPKFSLVPVLNQKAYVHVVANETDVYWNLFPKFHLNGYFGIEKAQANEKTDANDTPGELTEFGENVQVEEPTGRFRDQRAIGIGLGADYDLGERASIHLRHRKFDFEDKNFQLDKLSGRETTIELKIIF